MKKGIRDRVAIIGTGVTKFGEMWDRDGKGLLADAVYMACKNANVDLRKDIEAVWVGNQYTSTGWAGSTFTEALKVYGKPVTRCENFCATGMDCVKNAAYSVAAGVHDIVLACGVEKLMDQGSRGLPGLDNFHPLGMNTSAPAIFALCAVKAFKEWGWSKEDLARVVVKNHHNGAKNPKAHFRKEIGIEVVMNAPMIAYPLGLYDCCAMSDGAAAVVLTTPEIAKRLVGENNYVTIKGIGHAVYGLDAYNDPDFTALSFPANIAAVKMAFNDAGITNPRKDLDFGIVHDCFSINELLTYQDVGLCKRGEAADLIRNGVTAIDGDFPINPDGGLKCFGHPIGATGVRMVCELTRQILGKAEGYQVKNARAGFAHNLGGPFTTSMITVVGSPDWEAGGK